MFFNAPFKSAVIYFYVFARNYFVDFNIYMSQFALTGYNITEAIPPHGRESGKSCTNGIKRLMI